MTTIKKLGEELEREDDIRELLEENLEKMEDLAKDVRYIKKYIFWAKVGGFLKILLIVLPIILGYLYLQPLLNSALKQYEDLLGIKNTVNGSVDLNKIDLKKISPDVLEMLKK